MTEARGRRTEVEQRYRRRVRVIDAIHVTLIIAVAVLGAVDLGNDASLGRGAVWGVFIILAASVGRGESFLLAPDGVTRTVVVAVTAGGGAVAGSLDAALPYLALIAVALVALLIADGVRDHQQRAAADHEAELASIAAATERIKKEGL